MNKIIELILKIWGLFEQMAYEYNKQEREKTIEKIKSNPNQAWNDKFAGGSKDENDN